MTKRYFRIIGICCALILSTVGMSSAQKKSVTAHGEIVELISYVKEAIKPTSPAGKEIAIDNVKKGGAFAMLEKGTNKIYLLTTGSQDTAFIQTISPYLGMKSFVKGKIYTRSGVRLIAVEDIGKSIK